MSQKLRNYILIGFSLLLLLSMVACGPNPNKAEISEISCPPGEMFCDISFKNLHGGEQDFHLGVGLEYPGVELQAIEEKHFDPDTGTKKIEKFVRIYDSIHQINGVLDSHETRTERVFIPAKIFSKPGQVLMQVNLGMGYDGTKYDFVIFSVRAPKSPFSFTCNPENFSLVKNTEMPGGNRTLMIHYNEDLENPVTWFGINVGNGYAMDVSDDVNLVSIDLYDAYDVYNPAMGHGTTRMYCTPNRDVVYLNPPAVPATQNLTR